MAKRRQQPENIEFNMTPMIDVTFQLIIFFIIAGQIVSDELAALKVPRPTETMAREEFNADDHIIVNIVSSAGDTDEEGPDASLAKYWQVNTEKIEDLDIERLKEEMRKIYDHISEADRPTFAVEIRGDYRVQYGDIETVLLAAAEVGIPRMNITAIVEARRE